MKTGLMLGQDPEVSQTDGAGMKLIQFGRSEGFRSKQPEALLEEKFQYGARDVLCNPCLCSDQ